ncbi:uncharacterized protein LOC124615616 isoform X1 [Schistocerca americana]|uniref:uncharacterized protein LOC124615616 isoform X1 n=1 Tax=Schistocerca americana TaxID=7009 RepID=UPI001F4F42A7|nr:uncharacterized protein LOC124615616 isoform X1 [Schistocerca americana]
MDSPEALDVSKENIQPLRQGRNASQLSAALQAQTDTAVLQNLVKKRQEYELLLRTYDGDDPLSIWFEYVEWVEQSFPKDGKEGNLMTLLQNCLTRFKESTEYFQDIRLVKLWIKYLEKLENPLELYSQLHCHGIGSQCALFYRYWAYELYENDDLKQANKVLLTGIGRNAQPIDELIRARQNFEIAVARRVLDKSLAAPEENVVEEERRVGNVLTTFGKKHKVPSVRIGGRVKSSFPGTLHSKENLMPQRNTDPVNIYEAENDPGIARSVNKMQTVPHLEMLKKENTKKPTPWSGVKQKSTYHFHPAKPSFQVLSEENAQPEPLNTVMFLNALKPKKKDDGFNCPIAIFEVPSPNQQPMYPKDQVYAGGTEYSLEELKAVKYMKCKERRNKELGIPERQEVDQMEITLCMPPHSADIENLNPVMAFVSEKSSVSISKKESNLCNYTENNTFDNKQQLSALCNNYEKCTHTEISTIGSECYSQETKLPEQSSVPNSQYQHCVEGPTSTDSAANQLAEMDNLCLSDIRSVLTPVAKQRVIDGSCIPENFKRADNFASLNKDHLHCYENTDTVLSNKQSSYKPALLLAENEQQKVTNQGTFLGKGNGYSVLTTGGGVSPPETVKAVGCFTSLNKEEIPHSKNADIILPSNKPSSCKSALLVAENEQQKQINQGKFSLKSNGFSVFTTDDIGARETVKASSFSSSLIREDVPCSENKDTILSSNKQSFCSPASLLGENEQQKLNQQSTLPVKGSGFSLFTTEEDIGAPETVKTGAFFTSSSLTKEEIPHSENVGVMLLASKPSSSVLSLLVAENEQKQISQDKCSLKSNGLSVYTAAGDIETPEAIKAGGFFTSSLNKEEIRHSENLDVMLSSNKSSSSAPTFLAAKNEEQKQISQSKSSLKTSDFSVFTADDGIGTPETLKAGDFFASLNKEETAGIMLPIKPSSCTSPLLLAVNEQQKPQNQGTFSVTTGGVTGAPETLKADNIFTCSKTEEVMSYSDNKNNVLLSSKVEGLSSPILMQGNENEQCGEMQEGKISVNGNHIPEFPIFSDEENCYAKGRAGFVKIEQENGFSGFPNKNKNLFSHSVLCGPNKPLHDDVRSFSSTTKKKKVLPFQLFIDDGEVPGGNEPCAIKRELFKDVAREPSDKLCDVNSKENMVLLSMYTPTNRPNMEKREKKVCEHIVTASMLKLKHKKATEQIKETAAGECEQQAPATMVTKRSEGCVPSSISASSEEVLKVINECWASPPKGQKDSGNELCPELHRQPEDRDFQLSSPVKLSAALRGETGLFPENKENALPKSTNQKENVVDPANTSVNDDFFGGPMGEPRVLDDTCCSLMFSKTLISSTPNRKSGGPLSSDSSDTSPPDSQEFKIPGRCTPLQAERFPIMPRPDALSVIMESSKENKSQSSSGNNSGGRATHHTAFSLVSPQTENTHSALEMQPTCEAHAVIMARSLPPHDEGDSSI